MKPRLVLLLLVLLLGGPGATVAPAEGEPQRQQRIDQRRRILEATEYLLEELEAHAHE